MLPAAHVGWRTSAEHAASPNAFQMPMRVTDRLVVPLTVPMRPRSALVYQVRELTEDFMALLRWAYKS